MRSVVSLIERPKRVCPVCRKFYVYFCIVCCRESKALKARRGFTYFCIAKDTFFKFLLFVCSYIFEVSIRLTRAIDVSKKKPLEGIYFRDDMEDDSGVDSKQETLSTTSTNSNISLHNRKSSNVFIQLMRSKKKKLSKQEEDNVETESDGQKSSKSRIPVPIQKKGETELPTSPEKSDMGESDEVLTKNLEQSSSSAIANRTKKGASFFNKFIKKQTSRNSGTIACEKQSTSTEKNFKENNETVVETISETSTNYRDEDTASEDFSKNVVSTKIIHSFNPFLEITLVDALQKILDVEAKLKDDQKHVTKLLQKYIHDQGFKKDLMDAVYLYSKLQIDTERRVQSLANEMWIHQSEISRNQENSMQDSLNALIKQNRSLQEENEQLLRTNEKLSAKIGSFAYLTTKTNIDGNHIVDSLSKNNEQLHFKLSAAMKQVAELENDLQKMQKHNERLEEKVRDSNSQMQSYKTILQRNKAESDLEIATITQKLQFNATAIKSITEAGEILFEDLEALKRKLKGSGCGLNWTQLKCRGNSLTDLIHMSRACINELAQEIIELQAKAALNTKDSDCLKEQIKKLQNKVSELQDDLSVAKGKEDALKGCEIEKQCCIEKNFELRKEVSALEIKINQLNKLLEKSEVDYQVSYEQVEILDAKLKQKDQSLDILNKTMEEVKSENRALIVQSHNLNKLLCESSVGDLKKQLFEVQEQLSYFKKSCYELTLERNELEEHLNVSSLEIERLLQQQQIYQEQIDGHKKEIEALVKEKDLLTEKLNAENITIIALQEERKRYLEEKNVLRTIYERLKKEIARSEQLQGTVFTMSKEASKLTLLAECNKLLGEKLKKEMKQREETISQLQNNIKTLNNAHLENTRDKLALCMELNEASTAKEHLNNVLSTEIKKNSNIEESKKHCENEAVAKLKAMEQMQKSERFALKKLLEDYKKVVVQRDQLLQKQQEWSLKMSDLQASYEMQVKTSTEITNRCEEKERSLKELEQLLQEKQLLLNRSQAEVEKYRMSCAHCTGKIEELKTENSKLESSVTYLQNTCQKLHSDFNDAKSTEVDLQSKLQHKVKENEKLHHTTQKISLNLKSMEQENSRLIAEIKRLSTACDKLINEYQENLKATTDAEKRTAKELQDLKLDLSEKTHHIQSLEESIFVKVNEIKELKNQCKTLQNESVQKLVAEEELGIQGRLLNESTANYDKLFNELKQLQEKYESTLSQSLFLSHELNNSKKELETVLNDKEQEYASYKSQLEDIQQGFSDENRNLKENLEEMCKKYEELRDICQREEISSKSLTDCHKDLSTRLLKAIRLLIDEKVARQSEKCRLELLTEEINKLKSEKDDLANKTSSLISDLETMQKQYDSLMAEKIKLENIYREFQGNDTIGKLQETQNLIQRLKLEIENLTRDINLVEFQKCEMSLRIHELQGELSTEKSLNGALRQSQQRFFDAVLQLKEDGEISDGVLEVLINEGQIGGVNV